MTDMNDRPRDQIRYVIEAHCAKESSPDFSVIYL